MGQGLRIGSLGGAPIRLSSSLLLLAVVLGVLYAPSQAEQALFGPAAWLLPVGYVLILILSVLLHELAHAWAGLAFGHRPTEIVVNIWGGHTQFGHSSDSAVRTALISAVGPLTNLGIAALTWVLLMMLPQQPSVVGSLLVGASWMNLLLGLFNLIPGLPMDGGQVLEAVVWGVTGRRSVGTRAAGWVGRVFAVGLVGWAVLQFLTGSRSTLMLVWSVMIAVIIWQGASAALRYAGVSQRAERVDLRKLVEPAVAVPVGTTLDRVLATVAANSALDPRCVVVMNGAAAVGILAPPALLQVPPEQRGQVAAEQVAERHNPTDVVDIGVQSAQLLRRLSGISSNSLVVTEQGRLVGVIPGKTLMQALLPGR